ncbi:uncharacterized protein AB675_341 [Cyphellophora attinorum]|uniref:DUF7730 domain-containing protein n=1 Tax=Cyphellophora attinorum TaxID=1664694 RepID=A0A0N0NS52_9EURO|nr:uncharacterized protein AB675_341 [Phialophora attinorum]KPI45599.1 hypothetical protein AB675_341 [Phialophora attinorum]
MCEHSRGSSSRSPAQTIKYTDRHQSPRTTSPVGHDGPADTLLGFPFLSIPGELRNKVYDLVIPSSHVLVIADHPQRDLHKRRKLHPSAKLSRYRLSGRILSIDDEEADPLGLIRSCRAISEEATKIFYSKTTPCFESLAAINKFLNGAAAAGLKCIRSISLSFAGYGEPRLTKNKHWKDKKDLKWQRTCSRIATTLVGLQSLNLDLRLATWPTTLGNNEDWTQPLMVVKGNGLHLVRLTLRHHMFNDTRLALAARRLENEMMTPEGREERDVREALQAIEEMEIRALQIPKAKKVLVIKQPVLDTARSKRHPINSKGAPAVVSSKAAYRTKGLAGYERIDLRAVGITFVQCAK